MATTLTRNLKLRINSNLTADAKYNLEKIDLLGSTFLVDTSDNLNLRSTADITIQPHSADLGGSGTGGTVTIGSASQPLDEFVVYADSISFGNGVALEDQAVGGNKKLNLKYKSDINGSVDTVADRNVYIDVDGSDRNLVLGANLSVVGVGSLVLNTTAASSVVLPVSGTLATLAGSEVLLNKTIDAASNTITGLVNANISASAAIAYSKLALSGTISNSDISGSAAIAYSKLSLAGSLVNSDISPSAAIAYSKLALSNSVTNADIAANAAIDGSKISPDFGNQIIRTAERLRFSEGGYNTDIRGAQAGQVVNWVLTLPTTPGSSGQVPFTDGSGNLDWVTLPVAGSLYWRDAAANLASLPTGQYVGEIRQALDTQKLYRWNGSAWVQYFDPLASATVSSVNGQSGVVVLDTDDISEGSTNLYYTDARFDTRLATKSTTDLAEGTNLYYTNARFDTRLATKTTTDLAEGSNLYFTDERAQDSVGNILTDTSSVDLTYNDAGNTISAVVLPAGVNHNALQNYVANEHVDHSAVSISTPANSGLAGGGNITASRNLVVDPSNATSTTVASGDLLLVADVSAGNALRQVTAQDIANLATPTISSHTSNWTGGTGTSIPHGLGTQDVIVQIYDNTTFETIEIDSVVRTDANTVTLATSTAPSGAGWRVLILAI